MTETDARRSFHDALDDLRTDVIRLAALATEQIAAATQALLDSDLTAVEHVIDNDKAIDALAADVADRCYLLIARQSPVAKDLRMLIGILRILPDLERSGDLMKNVAKAARRLYPLELEPRVRGILQHMGAQAVTQMRVAIDAFADSDPAYASALADMDDVMDDLTKSLFRAILTMVTPDESGLLTAVQLSLVGRFYERVADHSVSIAERVSFMVTGVEDSAINEPDEA